MKKVLDKWDGFMYNTKAVQNAAIAQPVERILGKDEVASSNLASSSKKCPKSIDFGLFCCNYICDNFDSCAKL